MPNTIKENELRSDFRDRYDLYHQGWANFLTEAQTDMEYYLDAQWSREEHAAAKRMKRSLYVFNKLARQVDLLWGYEIRNRHVLKIGPTGREDDMPCRQLTGLVMNLMASSGGYDILSDSFKWGPLVSGSNLMEIWKDRRGNFQFNRRGHNSFLLDPMLNKRDLSDCSGILMGDWIRGDRVKMLLPQNAAEIDKIPKIKTSGRWQRLSGRPLGQKDDIRLYEQWWQRKTTYKTMIIDRMTGSQMPFSEFVKRIMMGDSKKANWFIKNFKLPNGLPGISKFEVPINKVILDIFVDNEPVWHGDNPLGMDDYNFVWMAGDWVPECDRSELKLRSFARRIREPQKARNKRLNQILDIIETQLQSYRLVRMGSLVNLEDAYASGQRGPIFIKKDAKGMLREHFEQLPGAELPAGLFQILEVLDRDGVQAGGLNEEIMGSDDKDMPAILNRYRTGQALTGQGGLFSGFRQTKRQLGVKLVKLMQTHYDPNKVQRVLNEYPAPGFYQPDFDKYDCVPTEGLLTDSQRHLYYLELRQLRQAFPDAAQVIPMSMLVEAMPIQYKEKVLQAIKQAEQQQQQAIQAQMADKKRMDSLIEAQTQEDISQAQENRSGAALDRVKTIAEAKKLNIEPIMEMAKMAFELEMAKLKTKESSGIRKAKSNTKNIHKR